VQSLRVKVRFTCTFKLAVCPYGIVSGYSSTYLPFSVSCDAASPTSRVHKFFHKSGSRVKILGPRRFTWSKLHAEEPLILGATLQNSVAVVTWHPCFVPPPPPPHRTLRLAVKWTEFSRYACLLLEMHVLWLCYKQTASQHTTLNHRVQSRTDAFRHLLLLRHKCLESHYSDPVS